MSVNVKTADGLVRIAGNGGGSSAEVEAKLTQLMQKTNQLQEELESLQEEISSLDYLPTTGGTMTGLLQPKAGISAAGKNGFIAYPEDGYYNVAGSVNGCIKIKLPGGFNSIMRRFDVSVCHYSDTNTLIDLSVGCYPYVNKIWSNMVAKSTIAGQFVNKTYTKVGFCKDSQDNAVIIIGNTDSAWSYPIVQVHNILVGFSNNNYANSYSGWDVTITNDISDLAVQYTIEDTTI